MPSIPRRLLWLALPVLLALPPDAPARKAKARELAAEDSLNSYAARQDVRDFAAQVA
jgi:hypothetical protein